MNRKEVLLSSLRASRIDRHEREPNFLKTTVSSMDRDVPDFYVQGGKNEWIVERGTTPPRKQVRVFPLEDF